MSYEREHLVSFVVARLQAEPRVSLNRLAAERKVHRHTLARALDKLGFGTFSDLQTRHLEQAIQNTLQSGRSESIKEAAQQIGYAKPASLARRTMRLMGKSPTALRRRNDA